MTDIVVVCAWRRPELLALTLQSLRAARLADEHHALYRFDEGHDPENIRVVGMTSPWDKLKIVREAVRYAPTDTYNTMEAYKQAVEMAGDPNALIYMMQEDIIVRPDFFEFHRAAHSCITVGQPRSCVSAIPIWKWVSIPPSREEWFGAFTNDHYHPWAVSWRVQDVIDFILPHANESYYKEQQGYVRRIFPDSKIGHGMGEQDWLIDNIMHKYGLQCVLPGLPRAYHVGWWSDRREAWHPRDAKLEDRIAACRVILSNPARLAQLTDYADVKAAYAEMGK